ncbi:hypothetical protein D918_09482 [Trichuris suis]|nr:hypothetical protein D918_09482 [Trichuris suis]
MDLFLDLTVVFICVSFYIFLCLFCIYHNTTHVLCPTWLVERDLQSIGVDGRTDQYISAASTDPNSSGPMITTICMDVPPPYDEVLKMSEETPPPTYAEASFVTVSTPTIRSAPNLASMGRRQS